MHTDIYLTRCFDLAAKGLGYCSPNPMVGAVLVYKDRIIGEAYHQIYGGDHAEVACIKNVSEADKHLIKESTLYVSLEPCNHFGKTPPCTHLIIHQGIKKVVIGSKDPNPLVNGSGCDYLISHGVEVIIKDFEEVQKKLNKRFYINQTQKRPYIILKWAQSEDGFIGKIAERTKISHPLTDILVHKWRSEEDAIWVGVNTLLTDNPLLNTRNYFGKNPLRIVYDRNKSLTEELNFFRVDNNYLQFHSQKSSEDSCYVSEEYCLSEIIEKLQERNIGSVLVEGGSKLLTAFIEKNLFDEIRVIQNSALHLKQGIASPPMPAALSKTEELWLGSDKITVYSRSN